MADIRTLEQIVRDQILVEAPESLGCQCDTHEQYEAEVAHYIDTVLDQIPQRELLERISDALSLKAQVVTMRPTAAELAAIRERARQDNSPSEYTAPLSRDRRALIAEIDALQYHVERLEEERDEALNALAERDGNEYLDLL